MSKKGKLRSIHISPAQNGYTVQAHHDLAPGNGPGPQGIAMDPAQPSVFAKKKHVMAHVSQLLDEHEGGPGDTDNEAAETKVPLTHPARKLQRKAF